MKVFAAFVTYRPDPARFKAALESVRPQVDKVIVVDNTEHNKGIAAALNMAFEQAEAEWCDYLVTFDQDSIAPEGMVKCLLEDVEGKDYIGQVGPAYSGMKTRSSSIVDAGHLITSGSFTSVKAWREAGGFREDYFIDYVDVEFSYHLRELGYRVLMDTGLILDHQLGEGLKGWTIFGKKRLGFVDHVPLRWYYSARNLKYLCLEYRDLFPDDISSLKRSQRRRVLRMIVNGKGVAARLKMFSKGLTDYRKGITGPYSV